MCVCIHKREQGFPRTFEAGCACQIEAAVAQTHNNHSLTSLCSHFYLNALYAHTIFRLVWSLESPNLYYWVVVDAKCGRRENLLPTVLVDW